MALPGLHRRRPHRVHRARPRARRARSSSTCSAASTSTRSGPFVHDDGDWMAEHLNVHPRAVMRRNSFFRCGGQAIFEVFQYEAPDQDPGRRATATSAATTSRSTSTTSTPRSPTCASRASRVLGEPTASTGAHEGQRWVYFLRPGACSSSWSAIPDGKACDREPRRRSRERASDAGVGAASERIAAHLREAILGRRDRARASGSGRRRSPSGSAPAGCRCGRRCGCSRPRGSPSTSANKGARVPLLDHARGRRRLPDARAPRAAGARPRACPS